MKKIIKFFKIKKIFFSPPKKTDLIIFDRVNSKLFLPYLKNIKFGICDTRLESINLFIFIFSLLKYKHKFKFFYYLVEYIKYTNCKTIITFIDNNINFYKIKNFVNRNIQTISVQNGLRTGYFFKDLKNNKNLSTDFFLTFNDFYSNEYKKSIKGHFINTGSFKSNEIKTVKQNNNELVYISSGPEDLNRPMQIYNNIKIDSKKYFYPETILIKTIEKFCRLKNLNLKILGRARNEKSEKIEFAFYQSLLQKNINNDYYSFKNKKKNSYEICDQAKICVSIYSALGLEILSRYCKTVIFNFRSKATEIKNLNIFFPMQVKDNGEFWTSIIEEKNIFEKLEYVYNLNNNEWRHILNKSEFIKLLGRDEGNKNFLKILKMTSLNIFS